MSYDDEHIVPVDAYRLWREARRDADRHQKKAMRKAVRRIGIEEFPVSVVSSIRSIMGSRWRPSGPEAHLLAHIFTADPNGS